ncbi:MAG TPA: DHA2 family efflux MFS transporter permease subunit, partial [Granulicella sp.]
WITDNYSWRWIFYINIPVGILCVVLTRMVLEDPPYMKEAKAKARKVAVDWGGLGFISIGLATLEIVLDKGQELDWFGSPFIVLFASISAIALTAAVFWELNTKNPVVNLRLLKERNFLFCCLIILGLYMVLYATTYLLPTFMQQMMGYDATTAGIALSPAGLFTMLEVPLVGYVLTKGYDPRKMIFCGMLIIASACWWMGSMNLDVAERNFIIPRIVQVLGLGLITVPVSTIVFRFIPKTESSQGAGLYALVRNEGGSIGIALVSTMLQRRSQVFQTVLGQHLGASDHAVQSAVAQMSAVAGNHADMHYRALAELYQKMQQQALLLAYMDQFKMLCGVMVLMLPLVFFLKRPPAQKHVELDAH